MVMRIVNGAWSLTQNRIAQSQLGLGASVTGSKTLMLEMNLPSLYAKPCVRTKAFRPLISRKRN
jgi:hypothetical protein